MRNKKNFALVYVIVVLLACFSLEAYAESLSSGSVEGLPERLVVLDDSGQSVSDNGEYFFIVKDMEPFVTYTKNIQIMNLREDKNYRISFRAEPISKTGEIDLENDCQCDISLDGNLIYSGKVTGEGTPDIRDNALDLGIYTPSQSRNMTVNITWQGTSAGDFIDYGERVVTNSGVEITRGKSGENKIYGETEFRWIFYAEVTDKITDSQQVTSNSESSDNNPLDNNYAPYSPNQGINTIVGFVKTGGIIAVGSLIFIMLATLILIFLLIGKKKKQNSNHYSK